MPVITNVLEDFTKGRYPAFYRQVLSVHRSMLVPGS